MSSIQCTIRKACPDDAQSLLDLVLQLERENKYMLYELGERRNDVALTQAFLQRIAKDPKSVVLIAENGCSEIVGFICADCSPLKRFSHIAKVNIGILKPYRCFGLAYKLSEILTKHLREAGILRVEAEVIKDNIACVHLLKKFGYTIEGEKKCAVKIGNKLHDKYLIAWVNPDARIIVDQCAA